MLILCEECKSQVSDKALVCPHCGFPIHDTKKKQSKRKSTHKRLPNGFGQISEIKSKNLRERYRVMVTVGKSPTGKYICKILKPKGYFRTYNEAYEALVEYNKNPYDLEGDITVYELYQKWSTEYFEQIKHSSIRTVTSAWSYCSSVYDMRVKDIRARHIKGCMEEGTTIINGELKTPTPNTQKRIKSLFNLMLDYGLEYELIDKNYARTFNISNDIISESREVKRGHIPFTEKELDILWDNLDTIKYIDVILIQCYSGWRPQELGLLKLENINLDENLMTGGMKTQAGTNRLVPIHPKIRPLIEKKYNEALSLGSDYLLNCSDGLTHRQNLKFTYDKYRHRFDNIISELKLNSDHRPHDGRVTFITRAKKFHVDEYALKYMVGHAIIDLTEKVYTKREIPWFIEEMQKIK